MFTCVCCRSTWHVDLVMNQLMTGQRCEYCGTSYSMAAYDDDDHDLETLFLREKGEEDGRSS